VQYIYFYLDLKEYYLSALSVNYKHMAKMSHAADIARQNCSEDCKLIDQI